MKVNLRRKRQMSSKLKSMQNSPGNILKLMILLIICVSFITLFYNVRLYLSSNTIPNKAHGVQSINNIKKEEIAISSKNNNNELMPHANANAVTICYAVSVTSCTNDQALIDAAAVLKHSIYLSSIRNPKKSVSKYDFQMAAIIHVGAVDCIASKMESLGYKIYVRDTPVQVEEIEGEFLRSKVRDNGCCGEKEYIKLWSFAMTEYPIVVHLDLDTVVFRPLDALFDLMLTSSTQKWTNEMIDAISPMWPDKPLPTDIQAYFTRDYNMANPSKPAKHVGIQGGFFVVRPNMERFNELKEIIRKGDYRSGSGWGGLNFGPFYGGMTFQGIIPYFYDALHPNTAIELNRCYYNNMGDNPRTNPTKNNIVSGICRDGREDCEDCRELDVDEVMTAHFTLCQKPWLCLNHDKNDLRYRLCGDMHRKWFQIRADLEGGNGKSSYEVEQYFGFCTSTRKTGYIPYSLPF